MVLCLTISYLIITSLCKRKVHLLYDGQEEDDDQVLVLEILVDFLDEEVRFDEVEPVVIGNFCSLFFYD